MLFKQYPSRLGNSFEDFDKIIDELRILLQQMFIPCRAI